MLNLNQVTVPTKDLDRSVNFYEILGLRLIVHAPPHYARFECPEGDATFSIHLVDSLPQGEGISIYFECADLDKYVEQLNSRGWVFDEMPEDKRWLWREARLKDPDGNRIILFWGGENRKNPPWRI